MKDTKPDEEAEFIEMRVPMGMSSSVSVNDDLESAEDGPPGSEEEAPPPSTFQYFNWDD